MPQDNTTRRDFLGKTALASLAGAGLTSGSAIASGSNSVSGSIRGIVEDGRIQLDGKRDAVSFRDNQFRFDGVSSGIHELSAFEFDRQQNGNDRNGNHALHRTVSIDGDTQIDLKIDSVRGTFIRPPASIEELKSDIDTYADLGITDLYVETFFHGETVHASDYAPRKSEYPEGYFRKLVDYAHRRGIRVHAWIEVSYWWNAKWLGDVPDWHPLAGDDEIAYRSPYFNDPITLDRDKVTATRDGKVVAENGKIFASPFNQGVRKRLVALVEELETEYEVDGINLDYIRFPGFDYTDTDGDGDKEFLDDPYGFGPSSPIPEDATYEEAQTLRIEAITSLVEAFGEVVRTDTLFSADVFNSFYTDPPNVRLNTNKAQDWKSWIGTTGMDWIHPMCYDSIYGWDALRDALDFAYNAEAAGVTILPGLTNLGGHESFQAQWVKALAEYNITGYIAFKGSTIDHLDQLP